MTEALHHTESLAWIGLGANLGNATNTLEIALRAIEVLPHTSVEAASPLYSSTPIDAQGPDYTNAVVRIRTKLLPMPLLRHLQDIENAAGRERPYRNAPRTLDLDLLMSSLWQSQDPVLTLPHPRLYERAFVLRPLADINPDMLSVSQLEAVAHQSLRILPVPQQWSTITQAAIKTDTAS